MLSVRGRDRMVRLDQYTNAEFRSGRRLLRELLWFVLGAPIVSCRWIPFNVVRTTVLRLFGAGIGRGVIVKPGVRVKYPWILSIGAHSWVGEDCWIDNLVEVTIGENVCVSQGVYLCTGNHRWDRVTFDLCCSAICIEDGAWIAARCLVGPGVSVGKCGVAMAGSVISRNIPPYEIHAGNPAKYVKIRQFAGECRRRE